MGFLIFIILGGISIFGVLCVTLIATTSRASSQAKAEAPATLDNAFDGREDVIFKISMASLPYEDVVIGAKRRGYKLASQSAEGRYGSQTLIFERVA